MTVSSIKINTEDSFTCFVSPPAALVAVAQFIDTIDLIFREGDSPNQLPLVNDELCVEVVPPGYPGVVQVTVDTTDDSATRTISNYTHVMYLVI